MASRDDYDRSHLQELTALVHQHTNAERSSSPYTTAIDGLSILRSNPLKQPSQCMIKPALCITLQGEKSATFGVKPLRYHAGHGLVVAVEMPESGTVRAASKTQPYLGLVLELNLQILQEFVEASSHEPGLRPGVKPSGPFTLKLNTQLIDCALRAVKLLATPEAIAVLYPGIMREICYWLLKGAAGDQLAHIMNMANGQNSKVKQAIQTLRDRFREHFHIEDLAHAAYMSPTTFHRQFKMVTSMAPLQFQKQLRLFEARRLMISNHATVESAASEVGYASVSQFSREYARKFGNPPRREVSAWRSSSPLETPVDEDQTSTSKSLA